MIKIGDYVIATKMPTDSHFTSVVGHVEYIRNGYVGISASLVKSKWSEEFAESDYISVAAKIEDVIVL